MPVLAKSDKGAVTGVCHDRIDLRDSVDDEKPILTGPGACWWQVHGIPLQCFPHVKIETKMIGVHWLEVTSIDRTSHPAELWQGPLRLPTGG